MNPRVVKNDYGLNNKRIKKKEGRQTTTKREIARLESVDELWKPQLLSEMETTVLTRRKTSKHNVRQQLYDSNNNGVRVFPALFGLALGWTPRKPVLRLPNKDITTARDNTNTHRTKKHRKR